MLGNEYVPRYIIDSWAWIEYYKGSKKGRLARDKIEVAENYTASFTLAELSGWFIEHEKEGFDDLLNFIKEKSVIIEELKDKTAIRGGELRGLDKRTKKKENPMSYIDGILKAIAEEKQIKVLTGDPHFKDFGLCEYIGRD